MTKTIFILIFISVHVMATEITEIKNKLILIVSDEDLDNPLNEGMTYTTSDSKSEIKIQKIKKNRAIGVIVSGSPHVSEKINLPILNSPPLPAVNVEKPIVISPVLIEEKKSAVVESSNESELKQTGLKNKLIYGVLLGITNDSMNAEIRDQFNRVERINLKGTSSTFGASLDYYTTNNLALRAELSSTTLKVNGSSTLFGCENNTTTNCDANISFLSTGVFLKYLFTTESPRLHLRAGLDFLSALSKKSNFIKTNDVSSFQAFTLGLGLDIKVANNFYVPLTVDFSSFPATNTVNTSKITLTTGLSYE